MLALIIGVWGLVVIGLALVGCLTNIFAKLKELEQMMDDLMCDCPDDPPTQTYAPEPSPQFLVLQHLDRSMTRH